MLNDEGLTALRERSEDLMLGRVSYPGMFFQMDSSTGRYEDAPIGEAVVASDVGNCQMWARTWRRIATPESFMQSGVWNAMSYALPTAMVAKM